MKIVLNNVLLKWYLDSFFSVDTVLASEPNDIINAISQKTPDVFLFGDCKNKFSNSESEKLYNLLSKRKINIVAYGGWNSFGGGGYQNTFLSKILGISFIENEIGQVLFHLHKANDAFFSLDFNTCPKIASYNRIILAENYQTQINWIGNNNLNNPLLLTRNTDEINQVLILCNIISGGAKNFMFWKDYPQFLKETLEWATNKKLPYSESSKQKYDLVEILNRFWHNELFDDFWIEFIENTNNIEVMHLLRDLADVQQNWKISSILAKKYYDACYAYSPESTETQKAFAEYYKILGICHINEGDYGKAAQSFKEGSQIWNDLSKNKANLTASGFTAAYLGISYLYDALNNLEQKPRISKSNCERAILLFEDAIKLNGSAYAETSLNLAKLVLIAAERNTQKKSRIKSLWQDFLFFYKSKRYLLEIAQILIQYTQLVQKNKVPILVDVTLLESNRYKLYYSEGFLSKEHYTILSILSDTLKRELKLFQTKILKELPFDCHGKSIDMIIDEYVAKNGAGEYIQNNSHYHIYGDLTIKTVKGKQIHIIEQN